MKVHITYKFVSVDPTEVVCVYTGKEGCRCGCNGRYFYAETHREYSSKDRGYEVKDDEINDRKIKSVCKILNERAADVELTENYILNLENDGKVLTAYLKQPSNIFVMN